MVNKKKIGQRIALGTVQFGLNYGISNYSGKVLDSDVYGILIEAQNQGINTIDTAVIYGESEAILGKSDVSNFKVVTKLPPIPLNEKDIDAWAKKNVYSSLSKLGINHLYGLLLHKSSDLIGDNGKKLYDILCNLQHAGLSEKIGVSIYSPQELDYLEELNFKLDIVQAPFNIFDRRLKTSGWLRKLKESGVEIHTRSVFLQGLLLLKSQERNLYFEKWKEQFNKFEAWYKSNNQSPLEACLDFVFSFNEIDKIVIGVESKKQLEEIIFSVNNQLNYPISDHLEIDDIMLIDPSKWKLSK